MTSIPEIPTCFLLRGPAFSSPDEAGLKAADRCHSLPSLPPPRRRSGRSPSPVTGGMYHPDSVVKLHQKILKDAGLERIRFHDLRHTFATLALQNGIDVKTVSSMLGHSSAGFTLATYTHATNKVQEQAAAKMGNLLKQAL